MPRFVASRVFDVPARELFDWHARPGAFERLSPPWQDVTVVERSGGITDGSRLVMELALGPLKRRWVAEHRSYRDGESFTDVQVEGPFARWEHTHRVRPLGEGSELVDDITYELPFGAIGAMFGAAIARRQLERLFAFRHARLGRDLERHARAARPRMRVALSGPDSPALVAIEAFLRTGGYLVHRVSAASPSLVGPGDGLALSRADAVVHAGVDTAAALAATIAGARAAAEAAPTLPTVVVIPDLQDRVPGEPAAPDAYSAALDALRSAPVARAAVLHVEIVIAGRPAHVGDVIAELFKPRVAAAGLSDERAWLALDDLVGAVHHALVDDRVAGAVTARRARGATPVLPDRFTRWQLASLRVLAGTPRPEYAAGAAPGRSLEDVGFARLSPTLAAAAAHESGRLGAGGVST